jgi:hypothetical protein
LDLLQPLYAWLLICEGILFPIILLELRTGRKKQMKRIVRKKQRKKEIKKARKQ